jgi:hypothetical protein
VVFAETVGSHEICPVCFWEDDLIQTRWPASAGGANRPSLIECQRNYQIFGAMEARFIQRVRPAADDEPVEAGWYPLGPASLDCFGALDESADPWPRDRSVLYWWRPTFWRARPPRWAGWTGPADLTDPENWTGGFYELGIELADDSDEHLQRVLTALWHAAGVEGCYRRLPEASDQFEDVPCTVAALGRYGHLRATVVLPTGQRVVCGAVAIRGGGGTDWLDFYVPTEALSRAERRVGAFPFGADGGASSLAWREPIDDWLAGIAAAVFRTDPFRLALIGHEVSGDVDAESLGGQVPDRRFIGYLVPGRGGLEYTAANC